MFGYFLPVASTNPLATHVLTGISKPQEDSQPNTDHWVPQRQDCLCLLGSSQAGHKLEQGVRMGVIQAQGNDCLSTVCRQDPSANLWGNIHTNLHSLGTACPASDCTLAASAGELIWDKGITNKSLPPPRPLPRPHTQSGEFFSREPGSATLDPGYRPQARKSNQSEPRTKAACFTSFSLQPLEIVVGWLGDRATTIPRNFRPK